MTSGKRNRGRWFAVFVVLLLIIAAFAIVFPRDEPEDVSDDVSDEPTVAKPKKVRAESYEYESTSLTIVAEDGVKLPAHVLVPQGEAPEGGFPVVIFVHSWLMNQLEYIAQEGAYAESGYIVFSYDCRGWWLGGGRIGVAGPNEMSDISTIIDWILENTPADPECIGITGVSYGGGQSLLAPAFDDRIATAVSMSGWADLTEALVPNGSPKIVWSTLLVGSATLLARPELQMIEWILTFLLDTSGQEETMDDLWERSAMKHIDSFNENGAPVFIINNINDDLFAPGQMFEFYDAVETPKKITIANGIHGTAEAPGLLFLPSWIWTDVASWFDYWLWGEENDIMEADPIGVYQTWDGTIGTFEQWPVSNESMTMYLVNDGGLLAESSLAPTAPSSEETKRLYNTLPSPASSGIPAISPLLYSYLDLPVPSSPNAVLGLSTATVSYESEAVSEDVAILGMPDIDLWVTPTRDEFQVNIMYYDIGSLGISTQIGHTTYTAKGVTPDEPYLVSPDTDLVSHKMAEGHKLRIVVSTSDILYALPLLPVFGLDIHSGGAHASSISMPLLE